MAIENMPGGGVIATGKEDIRVVALTSLAYGIVLEMETGMKPTRNFSALRIAQHHGLIPEGTRPQKKKILRLVVQAIREAKPGWEPSAHLAKALAK
ncbi:hypothetical protein SEA_BRUHMOMENT_98 [Arthrobacter phage BruhMoment]|nr:hypothetical protein SEA_BRUHMOMENT_98 [Arthrobacter phage BruhMoment]